MYWSLSVKEVLKTEMPLLLRFRGEGRFVTKCV